MHKILLIDDDNEFKESFKLELQTHNLQLVHKTSLEGLQEILPKVHNTITTIVLDIKCLITENQEIENENFILTALKYLDTNFPNFPRIILTGDDEAFSNFKRFSAGEHIFQKTPNGLNEAINKIKFFCSHLETAKVISEYDNVLKIIRNYGYDQNSESNLIQILVSINEKNFTQFGGVLRNIRALQETIYKTINKHDKSVIPDNLIRNNGMIDFNKLMAHLNGNPRNLIPTTTEFQNSAIFNLSNSLYWVCGKYIHSDPKENYHISNYTIKSLTYNLLELLIWSSMYLPKKKPTT
ncbi:hypothetical protein HNP29_000109 [Pseudomonas alcaligenes]|nr:hypothetical protein [Pseudomonas alcaligenes]